MSLLTGACAQPTELVAVLPLLIGRPGEMGGHDAEEERKQRRNEERDRD